MLNPEARALGGKGKALQYTTCNLHSETAPPETLICLRTLLVCNLLPWEILRRLNGSSCPSPPSATRQWCGRTNNLARAATLRCPVPAPSGSYSPYTPTPIPSARPDPTCKVVVASIVVLTETHRVDQTPGSCLAPDSGTHHFASYISVVGALLHHRFSTPRLIRRFHFESCAFKFFSLCLVFEPRPRLPGTGTVATAGEARVWTPLNL